MNNTKQQPKVAIIGAGASGLMTASFLSQFAIDVFVYEQMPTAGRKILWAGKTGLNVSHNEPIDDFVARYTPKDWLAPYVHSFGANEIRAFMARLGIETYIGSSGRIFPIEMKASKFLRAWLSDLTQNGVQFFYHHQLLGINNNELEFLNKKKQVKILKSVLIKLSWRVGAVLIKDWAVMVIGKRGLIKMSFRLYMPAMWALFVLGRLI